MTSYLSDYKTRLIQLRLLPLMYIFETSDILFFIKNLKYPTNNFNINTYISFSVGNTRSYGVKLRHNASSTNKERHFYFNRISRLWNSLPIIYLSISSKAKSNLTFGNILSKPLIQTIYINYIIFVLVAPVYLIIL